MARRFILALTLVLLILPLFGGAVAAAPGTSSSNDNDIESVDPSPPGPDHARHPLQIKTHGKQSNGQPLATTVSPSGYTPSQIQAYLGLSGDGSGQTIAIVDAYDDPNIAADLNAFSQQFGLPLRCGSAGADPTNCFTFTKAMPQGIPLINAGWSLEIALDVEWAHAVAPKASILLVEAQDSTLANLFSAIDYAGSHGASVISNSWGSSEFWSEKYFDSHCVLSTAVCVFSSGDAGNPGMYPAYNPSVISVGGTTLNLSSGGGVLGESAWKGSGGGVSSWESKPAYQNLVNSKTHRGIPDVSYDADPNTGFAVYDSVTYNFQSGWFQVGGTSAGAPQWAAIIAVADQLRASGGQSKLNSTSFAAGKALYSLKSGLADITSGTNGTCGAVCTAGTGYDFVTGLGSPRAGIDVALSGGASPASSHDVAVTSVSATPSSLPAGQSATVTVTVQNLGSQTEGAVQVALAGSPSGAPNPPSQTVSVAAGQSTTVTFTWQTKWYTGANTYTLTATAQVAGDGNSANNSSSTTVQVVPWWKTSAQ